MLRVKQSQKTKTEQMEKDWFKLYHCVGGRVTWAEYPCLSDQLELRQQIREQLYNPNRRLVNETFGFGNRPSHQAELRGE